MQAKKDAAMRVPPAALVSVSSNDGGGGGGGGRFPVRVYKILKKALIDDMGTEENISLRNKEKADKEAEK